MSGSLPSRVKPLSPPPSPSPAQEAMSAVMPTAPINLNAESENGGGFEMTIPYEGGSRFIQMLNKECMTIGRREDNDIVLCERCVSGHHAEFRKMEDGSYEIVDLNSYNGTFVNGVRVEGSRKIEPGDVLVFGHLRTQIGTSLDPAVTQRLSMTIEQLNQEVSRLNMERDTCRYSLSQLKSEHEESMKATHEANQEKHEQETILADLKSRQLEEKRQLEALAMETSRIREERGRLLVEAESVKAALKELQEQKEKLETELDSPDAKESQASSAQEQKRVQKSGPVPLRPILPARRQAEK